MRPRFFMDKLFFYEIDEKYIDFLSKFSEHLFRNARIGQKTVQITRNAKLVYEHKITNDGKSKLSLRCSDFKLLEEKSKEYKA